MQLEFLLRTWRIRPALSRLLMKHIPSKKWENASFDSTAFSSSAVPLWSDELLWSVYSANHLGPSKGISFPPQLVAWAAKLPVSRFGAVCQQRKTSYLSPSSEGGFGVQSFSSESQSGVGRLRGGSFFIFLLNNTRFGELRLIVQIWTCVQLGYMLALYRARNHIWPHGISLHAIFWQSPWNGVWLILLLWVHAATWWRFFHTVPCAGWWVRSSSSLMPHGQMEMNVSPMLRLFSRHIWHIGIKRNNIFPKLTH